MHTLPLNNLLKSNLFFKNGGTHLYTKFLLFMFPNKSNHFTKSASKHQNLLLKQNLFIVYFYN